MIIDLAGGIYVDALGGERPETDEEFNRFLERKGPPSYHPLDIIHRAMGAIVRGRR